MAITPVVVTVERAWHHIQRLMSFTQATRIRHAQAFTYQLRQLMRRR